MIKAVQPDRVALIEDGRIYTYGDIIRQADDVADQCKGILAGSPEKNICTGNSEKNVAAELGSVIILENDICLIVKDTVALELVYFIGIMKTGKVPVICGSYPDNDELDTIKSIEVPYGAIMGVMTPGTTGSSKVLFRTMESWADYFPVQNKLFSMGGDTVLFTHGSLSFTGNLNLYMGLMHDGGRIVTTRKFDPRYWAKCIDENYVNYIYLIPVKMMALVKS